MGLPLTTAIVEYAYVKDVVLLPNIASGEAYKHRISINFDLCDADKNHLKNVHREYYSNTYEDMQSYAEYTTWRNANEAAFIAAGKLELSGFGA